jgi:hypothetical protein
MTINYVSAAASGVLTTVASVTVNKPAGAAVGHLLVAHCSANSAVASWTAPSGWNLEVFNNTSMSSAVFTRWVDGTEGTSFTFTRTNNTTNPAQVIIDCLSGVGSIQAIALANSTGTTITLPSITAAAGNTLWQMVNRLSGTNAWTAPATTTKRYDFTGGGTSATQFAGGDEIVSAGATGTRVWTTTSGNTRGVIMALNDAQVNLSASDSSSLSVTETRSSNIYVSATDTLALGLSEQTDISVAPLLLALASADEGSLSISESARAVEPAPSHRLGGNTTVDSRFEFERMNDTMVSGSSVTTQRLDNE